MCSSIVKMARCQGFDWSGRGPQATDGYTTTSQNPPSCFDLCRLSLSLSSFWWPFRFILSLSSLSVGFLFLGYITIVFIHTQNPDLTFYFTLNNSLIAPRPPALFPPTFPATSQPWTPAIHNPTSRSQRE